jgi:cold shock CspA family protein
MVVDFGYIEEYNPQRGFGFVGSTFQNKELFQKGTFFHITKIKRKYPDLAQNLDNGIYENICFWYEIDKKDNKVQVCNIWLNTNDVPTEYKENITHKIEELWLKINKNTPHWLEQITIDLLGLNRTEELKKTRVNLKLQKEEAEQKNNLSPRELRAEFIRKINQRRLKDIYLGLPIHLVDKVLWVSLEKRKNPLSHIPGGSDVVVEYHNGCAFGYNRIKLPSSYIYTILYNQMEDDFDYLAEQSQIAIVKDRVSKIFAREYDNQDERYHIPFEEVWNSETSNNLPWQCFKH